MDTLEAKKLADYMKSLAESRELAKKEAEVAPDCVVVVPKVPISEESK